MKKNLKNDAIGGINPIPFYVTLKKCDPGDKFGLMENVKNDLAKNAKGVFANKNFKEQVDKGEISAGLLFEIVTIAITHPVWLQTAAPTVARTDKTCGSCRVGKFTFCGTKCSYCGRYEENFCGCDSQYM